MFQLNIVWTNKNFIFSLADSYHFMYSNILETNKDILLRMSFLIQ